MFTSVWSPVWTSIRTHNSSGWEETLNVSVEDVSGQRRVSKIIDETLILAGVNQWNFALPGSLQSFKLRLNDLVRDMLTGCLSDGPRREDRPEGCDVEELGPELGRLFPVFKWSFSAFRFSTMDYDGQVIKKNSASVKLLQHLNYLHLNFYLLIRSSAERKGENKPACCSWHLEAAPADVQSLKPPVVYPSALSLSARVPCAALRLQFPPVLPPL